MLFLVDSSRSVSEFFKDAEEDPLLELVLLLLLQLELLPLSALGSVAEPLSDPRLWRVFK